MLAGLYSFYGSGSSHSSGKSTKTKGSKARRKKAYAARKHRLFGYDGSWEVERGSKTQTQAS